MTLQELISSVRENVQDPAATRWSDSLITRYLNEAQRQLAPFSYSLTYWETSVQANQSSVTRPPDLLVPNKVTFRQGDDEWELVRRQGMPDTPTTYTGSPAEAFFLTDAIHLRPVPDSDGLLRVAGTVRPTDMVSSTDVPTLIDAEPVLVAYATWVCLAADVDPSAESWLQIYEQRRREWLIFDAMRNPQRSAVRRAWWW